MRCQSAEVEVFGASEPSTGSRVLRLKLPTRDVHAAVKFNALPMGRNRAIVVSQVAAGSESAAAGLRPGMQLLALSDPIQPDITWSLSDSASLRYIRDAVRMRRADYMLLEVTVEPVIQAGNYEVTDAPDAEKESGSDQEIQSDGFDRENYDLLSAIANSIEATPEEGSESQRRPGTIGERLQQKYDESSATPGMTALERRMARRKKYMAQVSERNDSPFFAWLLAAFVLPALCILAVAASTGYLDSLSRGWTRF